MTSSNETFRASVKHIGSRLRLLRLLNGATQQAVGQVLGVSFQQVQKYERGMDNINLQSLCRLSHYFNVPLESWLREDERVGLPKMIMDTEMDGQSLQLWRAFNAIHNPAKRKLVIELARSLCDSAPTPLTNTTGHIKHPQERNGHGS